MSESQFSNPLLSHYEALLNSLSLYITENGQVYSKKRGSDVQIPTIIENRRLTLPTEDMLRAPDWENMIFFHPFSESVVRGESEMVTWLKERMTFRLTATLSIMITKLTEYAAIGDMQTKLTTDQLNTLQTFGDADEKTIESVGSLIEAVIQGKGQLIHFYLRHSGKGGDKTARRFAKVTFPIYKELTEDGNGKIYGVNLRVKDRKFLKNVLEYIFDKIATEDAYSYGSNSEIAPYYHALINAYAKVGIPVSSRIYLFRGPLKEIMESRIHTDGWLDTFDAAAKSAQFVKAMPYNIGKGGQGTGNEDAIAVTNATMNIIDEPAPEQKVNKVLANTNTATSGLAQAINNQGNAGLGLGSALGNGQSQQSNALGGLPRGNGLGGGLGGTLNTTQAKSSSIGGGSTLGLGGTPAFGGGGLLGGNNNGLGGFGQQNQFGGGLGGLPRR